MLLAQSIYLSTSWTLITSLSTGASFRGGTRQMQGWNGSQLFKVRGRITAPPLHITTLFMTTSSPFCLNYRIYIYIFSLMTPISPSAFQLRLVLRVQCLRSWRMQKECTQTKINVNIWGRDKQFLREKNYIVSICAELISYQRLQLQPKSNICLHHSSPGHSNMLKACREPF